ncbi:MAG: response regulator transcription factor [Rhizobiaceae bacterium]
MTARTLVLIADDDPHICEVVAFAIEAAGMKTLVVHDGRAAIEATLRNKPNLVILDVGMPELDGLDVCREVRRTNDVPILFLSARDEEIDRILGLELGADDYVTKPFSPRELVARVKSILKRVSKSSGTTEKSAVLQRGGLILDAAMHRAELGGNALELTALEFSIMRALLEAAGRVLSREAILETAYDFNMHVSDRTIDSHVRNIRTKGAALGCGSLVETVHGVGFRIGSCERT